MSRHRFGQKGAALALVLWMLVALSVLVAGLVTVSREGAGATDINIMSAKAFHLAKGVARLVIRDRALSLRAEAAQGQAPQPHEESGVYTAQYRFDQAVVTASVFPAAAFLSVATPEAQQWIDYLGYAGNLSPEQAAHIFSQFGDAIDDNSYGGGSASVDTSTFAGYVRAYGQEASQGGSDIFYVEGLLSLEGMTRKLYDKIHRSVSPFRQTGDIELSAAPPEIRAAFGGGEIESVDKPAGATRYFCVEVQVQFDGGDRLTQRVWVDGSGAGQTDIKLVRIGRPVPVRVAETG